MSDIDDERDISYGDYVVEQRMVVFVDNILNVTILLKKTRTGDLRVVSGFEPLCGKVFIKRGCCSDSCMDYREITKEQMETGIFAYQNQGDLYDVSLLKEKEGINGEYLPGADADCSLFFVHESGTIIL